MDGTMAGELDTALARIEADRSVRALVLAGAGAAFCPGMDTAWLTKMSSASMAVSTRDAMTTNQLLARLDGMRIPTIARVHGSAQAFGLGLVAACDIAVASLDAEFCFPETRLGLAATVIAPYVVRAMGERQARRYLLSGERFTAAEAYRVGLVHELSPPDELDSKINDILGHLLAGGPQAVGAAKEIVASMRSVGTDRELGGKLVAREAELRATVEAKAGMKANLKGTAPDWTAPKNRAKTGRRTAR